QLARSSTHERLLRDHHVGAGYQPGRSPYLPVASSRSRARVARDLAGGGYPCDHITPRVRAGRGGAPLCSDPVVQEDPMRRTTLGAGIALMAVTLAAAPVVAQDASPTAPPVPTGILAA